MSLADQLANTMVLGALLLELRERFGDYELVAHWKQGEFHHDVVLRLPQEAKGVQGRVVVVATNCNGGVKEVLILPELPKRGALWHDRCPENEEFSGMLPPILELARTDHYFDPCELLTVDARSELRPEHRQRQRGGGWEPRCKP